MIFVPLPFVAALLLVLLAVRSLRRGEEDGRQHGLFLALICAYVLQSVLIGLRWGYDLRAVQPVQAVLASLVAPLAYCAFRSLAEPAAMHPGRLLAHLAGPPLVVATLFALQSALIGPVIVALFLVYGLGLALLARQGPDGLVGSRLDGALRSYRALVVTAGALIGSAAIDTLISFDLEAAGGRHSAALIALFNLLAVTVLGAAAAAAEPGAGPEPEPALAQPAPAPPAPSLDTAGQDTAGQDTAEEDAAILAALEALMQERRLFADADLDLGRLARRLSLPARRLSQAINRTRNVSVSHYVNAHRVAEAKRLLRETDLPVTRVMFEAGFLTKSNFNREFRRLAGTSPSEWRAASRPFARVPAQPL